MDSSRSAGFTRPPPSTSKEPLEFSQESEAENEPDGEGLDQCRNKEVRVAVNFDLG